ncbi:MAG: hypothetical protein NVSMB12_04510 [Acidimicrobiales bacterium]
MTEPPARPGFAPPGDTPTPGQTPAAAWSPPPNGWAPPAYGPPPWALPKAGSAATGPLPLHPMTVGDILDGIFKLLRANFTTIAVIVGVLVMPLQLVAAFAQRNLIGGQSILRVINDPSTASTARRGNVTTTVVAVGAALVNVLLLPFVGGAIAKVVAASYVGQQVGPGEAMRAMSRRAPALFAAWWLWHPIEVVGLVCCVFPGVAWMTMFVMVAPAIVTEQLGPWAGLRRSWRLARRRFWGTMGMALLAGLLGWVLGQVLNGVPSAIGLAIGLHWGWLLLALGGALSALIVTPIAAITATLLYFDARIRTEGFDLEVLAAGLAVGSA